MPKIKILVVEDQKATALAIKRDLEKTGYIITSIVQYGEDVIKCVEKNKPDLILMDIILKGKIDGIDAAKQVQADFDLPVIYLTAHAGDDLFERAKLTDPFGYLIKPFESRELDLTIKSALNKHNTEKELKHYKHEFIKTQLMLKESQSSGSRIINSEQINEHIRKLHRVVEQNPAIVLITDKEGAIEYTNPAFTKVTGYAFEEVVGKNPRMFKSGRQSEDVYKKMWTTILSGREWSGEFCNKKKNGEEFWEILYVSPLKNPEGVVTNYVKTAEDITTRKIIEDELKQSHNELEERVRRRTKELEKALEGTKTLQGLIPICASCKKIRDDKGYWNHVEQYICEHSAAEFTHGICPDCKKRLYPQICND